MLNKELCKMGGAKTYTHIITTEATYVPFDVYDYSMKTISPKDIDGFEITSLSYSESSTTFIITIRDSTQYSTVYLGDFESKSVVPLTYVNTYSSGRLYQSSYAEYNNNVASLFWSAVNEAQLIWISFDYPF